MRFAEHASVHTKNAVIETLADGPEASSSKVCSCLAYTGTKDAVVDAVEELYIIGTTGLPLEPRQAAQNLVDLTQGASQGELLASSAGSKRWCNMGKCRCATRTALVEGCIRHCCWLTMPKPGHQQMFWAGDGSSTCCIVQVLCP